MEASTRSSLSMFRTVVRIVWAGLILVCVYLTVGITVGAANPRLIRPWLGAGFWGPGLVIGLPWESLTPAQWRTFLIPTGLWGLGGTVAVTIAVDQVRRILDGERDRSPFTSVNASRVRRVGVAVLCSGAAKALRDLTFGHFMMATVKLPGADIGYSTDLGLSTAFLGVMILAVAEVMRHGVKLQEEQDLTV